MTFSASILELLDASVGADHRDGSAEVIYVARVQPISLVTRATATIDVPSSTIPALEINGRLTPPNVRASILSNNEPSRGMTTTRGEIKFANANEKRHDRNVLLTERGMFDDWRAEYSWKARRVTIYIGPKEGAFPGAFEVYSAFTVDSMQFDTAEVSIRPARALTEMDAPMQSEYYTDGSIADGELKHAVYGKVFGIEPQVENEATELYGVHRNNINAAERGATVINAINAVYEYGLEYTPVTDYVADLATGQIDIISPTSAIITADVEGTFDNTLTYQDRPAILMQMALDEFTEIAPGDFATGTQTAYDAEFNYECGYHFGSNEVTPEEFLAEMTAPIGYWFISRTNEFTLDWLKHPATETEDLTLAERHVSDLSIKSDLAPAWRVRIGYQPLGTTLSNDEFLGAVTESERSRQSKDYQWVDRFDVNILALYPSARSLDFPTRFTQKADAEALADQVFEIYRHPRQVIEADLTQSFLQYDIGDIVRLGVNRYDLIDDGYLLQENGDKILLEAASGFTLITDSGDTLITDSGDTLVTDAIGGAGTDALLKEESALGTNMLCVGYVDNPSSRDFKVTLWG
jgi:hypothetical protein